MSPNNYQANQPAVAGGDNSPMSPGPDYNPRRRNLSGIFSTLIILVAAPLLALGLTSFVFQSYEVDGPSMENTLQNQDRLIVLKWPRTIARLSGQPYVPRRGDIIIFYERALGGTSGDSGTKQLIKRVVGLPNERIVVDNNTLTVFNAAHPDGFNPDTDDGYGHTPRTTPGQVDVTVPADSIFVAGDNRTNSLDSRSFGPVPLADVVGKLIFRLIPINRARTF